MTDDRGIYRIYGLLPGSYIVGASGRIVESFSPYEGSAATSPHLQPRIRRLKSLSRAAPKRVGLILSFEAGQGTLSAGL